MIFYSERKKVQQWLLDHLRYYRLFIQDFFIKPNDKKVYLEIEKIALNRYLYNFIKFFILNNYTVYLPANKRLLSDLHRKKGEFIYASWILKEHIKIGMPKYPDLIITKEQLSNDYFSEALTMSFHIPMSEYPGNYKNKFEVSIEFLLENRKSSVFMAGNIHSEIYNAISRMRFFDIPSRNEVYDFVKSKEYFLPILSLQSLYDFIKSNIDEKAILIDTSKNFRIPPENLKEVLKKFNFFLGLPGVLIPQCHNLIEAFSVGCIPILHSTYADCMKPKLEDNKNAFIFQDVEDLNEIFYSVFSLDEQSIISLRQNVLKYYNLHLSPKAVISNLENNTFNKIYLQAEEVSLQLWNKENTN